MTAAVGATTVVGKVVAIVMNFVTLTTPINCEYLSANRHCEGLLIPVALPTTLFLDALWVGIDVAMFCEVARQTIFGDGSAVSESTVVAVVSFVGAGHWAIVSIRLQEDPE